LPDGHSLVLATRTILTRRLKHLFNLWFLPLAAHHYRLTDGLG
jgi:hypothetical protein